MSKTQEQENNRLDELINNTLVNLKKIVDSSTIIGEPYNVMDASIVPVSKVTMGFVSGGGETNGNIKNAKYPFLGGSSAGVVVEPIGLLCIKDKKIEYVQIQKNNKYDDMFGFVSKLFKKGGNIEDDKK